MHVNRLLEGGRIDTSRKWKRKKNLFYNLIRAGQNFFRDGEKKWFKTYCSIL